MIAPPIIIAECGNNHEGDLSAAIRLLHAAAGAGADIVKFQAGVAEGFARDPKDVPQYRKYELGDGGYARLVREADAINVPICFSVWGEPAWLNWYRAMPYFKIAARQAEKNYISLYDRPGTFVSIGHDVSAEEIKGFRIRYAVPMHAVLQYPAADAQLERVHFLRNVFGGGRPIGYSDHTVGIDACVEAVECFQAFVVEKHFTLAHDYGPLRDHALSATPEEMTELVRRLK